MSNGRIHIHLSDNLFPQAVDMGKKVGLAVWIPMGILVWSRSIPFGEYLWLACLVGLFLMAGILLSPVDDLLVDEGNLYHIKTSLIRYFSRSDRYEILKIKSIRCTGVHEKGFTIREQMIRRSTGDETNTIEITFRDGYYKSIEVGVYKK